MPVLHVLAGPNGAGKSTYVARVLEPGLGLPFINADVIAKQRWPDAVAEHAYEAAELAERQRRALMAQGRSFITETVFSHESKVVLVGDAAALGYLVHLHVVLLPVDVTVQRVRERVRRGEHDVSEDKVRQRYARLWSHVAGATNFADVVDFFDNSRAATPFRLVATMEQGRLVGTPDWPVWTPPELTALGAPPRASGGGGSGV